jgi:hypothetical protein
VLWLKGVNPANLNKSLKSSMFLGVKYGNH